MNVVIACGGTGGHLFPGLAVAEVLQARGHQSLLFISRKEIDAQAVRDYAGQFRFEKLPSVGLPRVFSPAMLGFARGFTQSLTRCRRFYREFKPPAVLGMGAFPSTAPLLSGRLSGVPTFVHESNAVPRKANRVNARLSRVVLLGFEECAKQLAPGTHCEVTGTPIRSALRERLVPAEARSIFRLNDAPDKKTVLVMGGSQGAHGINQAMTRASVHWRDSLQLIHFTGTDDEQEVRAAYERQGVNAYVAAFHHRMQEAYSAADFVIARSGAASLSELAYFGLPSLLIPYPFAAEDHQTLNAQIFTRAGAAVSLKETDTMKNSLAETVLEITKNPSKLSAMSAAAQRLAPPDAAALLVDIIEKQCCP